MIFWLTGQPGAGKTTIAKELVGDSLDTFVHLDGDDLRELFQNKDFSEEGRKKNVELAQNISLFLHKKGFHVVVSMVSPFREQRERLKEKLKDDIVEIYVYTNQVRGRENFFVENYEQPIHDYLEICTDNITPEDCVGHILNNVKTLKWKNTTFQQM
jgi:adenylylsulfate kinase